MIAGLFDLSAFSLNLRAHFDRGYSAFVRFLLDLVPTSVTIFAALSARDATAAIESLSRWDLYRIGISIARANRVLDLFAQLIPRQGFGLVWLGLLYTFRAAGALKSWWAVPTYK